MVRAMDVNTNAYFSVSIMSLGEGIETHSREWMVILECYEKKMGE